MSFVTTQPAELAAAAGKLEAIGSTMDAQNAAALAPTTTGVVPAAADEISALQASLFTAYGTLYQKINADAAAMYQTFVHTLGVSAGTYEATEAANSSVTAMPLSDAASLVSSVTHKTPAWVSALANMTNIGVGNWASATSDLIGLAGGSLLPAAEQVELGELGIEAIEGAGLADLAATESAVSTPVSAGVGAASSVGAVSVPPSWAGQATMVSSSEAGVLRGAGWTTPAAQPAPAIPAVPGLALAARSSAGFGAPRYGVKPIVMPKPTTG